MSIRQFLSGLLLAMTAAAAQAELVVITHPASSMNSLPRSQLSRIFLGQSGTNSDGSSVIALDVSGGSRTQFYRDILGKDPGQIEKYWARMIFTGKAQPPREIKPADVKSVVAETPGAISYIDSSKVDGSVKVLRIDSTR